MRFRFLAALALITATAHAQHVYSGCQLFPTDAVFNNPVNTLPVSTNPAAQIPTADLTVPLHPIFGTPLAGGFTTNVVAGSQAMVTVTGTGAPLNPLYWTSAPIPSGATVEGGAPNCSGTTPTGDSHLIVLQVAGGATGSACSLYEAYGACPTSTGWNVKGQSPVFNLASDAMPPQDNTGPNAAGLPILPLLVTAQDIAQGHIDHMIAVTVPSPPEMFQAYIWPAADFGGVGKCTGGYQDSNSMLLGSFPPTSCPSNGPAAGTVYRRKAAAPALACVTAGKCPETAMIEAALAKYGGIVIDNGGPFLGILGEESATFSDTDLHNLTSDTFANFEPVEVSVEAADLTAPIGNASILAPVTTYRVNVATSTGTPVIITATYNGTTLTASAVVNPAPAGPTLQSLSITPSTLTVGQTSTLTITLNGPAPTGGATITLASNSAHFPVPASVTVAAGQTSASVAVVAQ